ncbi:MAG: ECF transporter S component [Ruminococcus sp.]|nr:ECF transporter S component [Ruminococcus sp.]
MTKTKKNAAPKFFKPVFTALLAALIVLLTFTVGSLRIGPITITFNCLPLAVGTVFLGPVYGAILGLVFGLSSFFASFTSASLTTILLSINPFFTFLMCVVPRVICGWLPGLLFQRLPKNSEPKRLGSSALSCALVTVLNTIGFLGLMWVFFADAFLNNGDVIGKVGNKPAGNVFLFIFALAGINAVIEIILNLVLGTAICRALFAVTKNKI